jgi:hypothetical protein
MNDQRVDSLIRSLDVSSDPSPEFVDRSFRVLADVARQQLRRDRRVAGRVVGWLGRPSPWTGWARYAPIAAALALAALLIVFLSLSLVGRRSAAIEWPARHVLFGRENTTAGSYDVFVIGADGTAEHLLLPAPREVTRVSSDGLRIASAAVQGDRVVPTILDADGGHALELRPDPTLNLGAMAWSHDGTWLAFEGWDDTNPDRAGIYLLRSDGTGLHRLTGSGVPSDFSPDDRSLVLLRPEGVFVVGVDGTGEHQVGTLKPDQSAGYMRGGQRLYAVAGGSIWTVSVDTGAATEIPVAGGRATSARLAPDGSRFVITYDATAATTTGIWTIAADGTGLRELADDPNLGEVWPDWLP